MDEINKVTIHLKYLVKYILLNSNIHSYFINELSEKSISNIKHRSNLIHYNLNGSNYFEFENIKIRLGIPICQTRYMDRGIYYHPYKLMKYSTDCITLGRKIQMHDVPFKSICMREHFFKIRQILCDGFNDLPKLYKFILSHCTLLSRCVSYINEHREKFDYVSYLPKDVRKLIKPIKTN